jgi:hypothetical protein
MNLEEQMESGAKIHDMGVSRAHLASGIGFMITATNCDQMSYEGIRKKRSWGQRMAETVIDALAQGSL